MTSKNTKGRMTVQRIETGHGSRIEPPCDEAWPMLDKLRWKAGAVHAATGLDIRVTPGGITINGIPQDGYYNISVGSHSTSAFTGSDAWDYMSGVATGYRAAETKLHRKVDRMIEILEDLHQARQAKPATGGTVKTPGPLCANGTGCIIQAGQQPGNGIQIHIDPHHVIGATIHELRRQGRLR